MRGNITRRGKQSWRIKFDIDTAGGQRKTRYVTVRGKRQDAQLELARLLGAAHDGTLVEPSKITVADYIRAWLDGPHGLAPGSVQRYWQLAEQQIIPHLGAVLLQKLRPAHLTDWHATLLTAGGQDGRPLSARTVAAAHRVLRLLLARAVTNELASRNVAAVVKPPKVEDKEVEILKADQIEAALVALAGHTLEPIAVLALGSGARRGELLALRWRDLDLDGASMRIERSLEQTKAGLRFRRPRQSTGGAR
jgi:integrase